MTLHASQTWVKQVIQHDGQEYSVQFDREPIDLLRSFFADKEVRVSRSTSGS